MSSLITGVSTKSGFKRLTILLGLAVAGSAVAAAGTKGGHQPIELLPAAPISRPDAQTVLGHAEKVAVFDGNKSVEVIGNLEAKEARSTLYVADMKYFIREGDQWVNFIVDNGHVLSHERLTLERKVLRDEHVKERGGGFQHRPWVEVTLCVGKHSLPVQVALADRSTYTAQLKLGAADIDKIGRVDPTLQYTAQPDCAAPTPPPSAAASAPSPP